jgi:ATP/ADP translocase
VERFDEAFHRFGSVIEIVRKLIHIKLEQETNLISGRHLWCFSFRSCWSSSVSFVVVSLYEIVDEVPCSTVVHVVF